MSEERIKPLVIHDDEMGTSYTLDFNRETVKWAESRGWVMEDISKYPQSKVPEFFFYAFRMHHKSVARSYTDHLIYDVWGGVANIPDGVLERLGSLYAQTFGSLVDEDSAKNAKVTVEF